MTSWDTELIPRESFKELMEQKKVVRTPASHGGIVHEVLRILEENAATVDAIAEMLKLSTKTVYERGNHLRHRYDKKVVRFYNPKDRSTTTSLKANEELSVTWQDVLKFFIPDGGALH